MALAKDEGTGAGRGRNLDTRAPGKVLYRSDFDSGFDGWTDHWATYVPQPIVSRSSEICYRGTHSLMLSTGEAASPPGGDISNFVSTFKRLARHDEYRYHHFSAYLGQGVGGYTDSWFAFQMYIDTQAFNNSKRSFYKLQFERPDLEWQIVNNSGSFVTVPGFHSFLGQNENKCGMEYVRLTVDMQANSGSGGYVELQSGNHVFDLTGLGAGSATGSVQYDGSNSITDFMGGLNLGFGLSRNTSGLGGCQLFVDDVVYSVSNTL